MPAEPRHHGLLLVDKEPACTSHDVVQQVRRICRQRRVGHCGTLDPGATGLLTITLGKATRLTRFLVRAPKVYAGEMVFGVVTDTYDAKGQTVEERPLGDLSAGRVEAEMQHFVGRHEQAAPPFSAKKVRGVRYYELARRGEEVPEAKKMVEVFEFDPAGDLVEGRISFQVSCSSGTYVRSLAHELGQRLGCGAHLASLRRLKVGPFELKDALRVDEVGRRLEAGEELGAAWVPFDRIPLPFGDVVADSQQEQRLVHGQTVLVRQLEGEEGDWVKLLNQRRQLIAVGTVVELIGSGRVGVVQPRIVFR